MSEHRSEYLNAKRCHLWPDCACKPNLVHWQNKLSDNETKWSFEDLRWAETSIFLTLSCVAESCPSPKYRAYAQVQLLNPYWDRQRLGIELTEEMCQQFAEKSNGKR